MKNSILRRIVILVWSDGSRNQFIEGDFEMEDFILWKQRTQDLTYEIEVMPISEYKLKY